MNSFSFRTVPNIYAQWGATQKLGKLLASWIEQRNILLVTDSGLCSSGIIDPIQDSLSTAGFNVSIFNRIMPDPHEFIVMDCIKQAREANVDVVIGIGGGSSMDVAKIAAVLINSEQNIRDMYGIDKVTGTRLPLVQVPTTAGTGSEVTNITIVSTGEPDSIVTKMGIVASQLYADHVILDAALTIGLPSGSTAATGIDAMVHAIEAYTTKHKKNPISDNLAREALRLLSNNLITACNDGNNREAREAMLLGACMAGQAFANAPCAAVHALAYPLGARYHIPHGLSNALMLEPVLRFNASAAAAQYAELAEVLVGPLSGDDNSKTEVFIGHMIKLMDASGVTRHLRDADVEEAKLPELAQDAMLQTRLLTNNPVEVDEAAALKLYQEAY